MAAKKAVNLSIDAELVAEARANGTNMSALLERSLQTELREKRQDQWRKDHAEAIANWNTLLDEEGLWSDMYKD